LTFRVSTDKLKSSLLFDLEVDRRPAWIAGNEQSLWCCSWMAGSPFFGQNRSQSVCFHAHSWCQYAVDVTECNDFSSFQFSLVTKGFGCQVMCSVQSLHQRPGWSALKVINYLGGGEPNLGLQLIATFHSHLPSVAYVMLCFCFEAFLCYCRRAVGEMCHDMEHIGGSNIWVSSITSAHKIWQSELKYPTPGLLGSSCSCKICSVLLQQLTVALNISLCQGAPCFRMWSRKDQCRRRQVRLFKQLRGIH